MTEPSEDSVEFDFLEEYVRELQSGGRPDREELLRKCPGLGSVINCLEALERVAPGEEPTATLEATDVETPSGLGRLPRDFGAYELLEEIGRGGMGVVYKARQKGLDRLVAVKMILANHLASPEHVRRFQVEAKAAARLRHAHIVPIHEVGQLHDQHFFAMEYIEGTSLAGRMKSGLLPVDTSAGLLEQVARAVAELHRHGIIHRDLTPSNILLDADEQPYVSDFGLAKVFETDSSVTATGVIVGTPSYMSPEQAAARAGEIGPSSDVYSLGAILYEMLTGRPAFREDTPLETIMQVLVGEPPLPRTANRRVPPELELVLMKCLAKSPSDRYPTADALADDLEHFLKKETVTARPPNPLRRLFRWVRREPAVASRLAVLGIFFAIENVNYSLGYVSREFHLEMSILQVVWLVATIGFQQALRRLPIQSREKRQETSSRFPWLGLGREDPQRWIIPARFVWGTFDSVMLLVVLLLADGVASPLVMIYPMMIVASGLWFRERFVWFIGILSAASYAVLLGAYYGHWHAVERPHSATFDQPIRHVIFFVALAGTAWGVAHLVHRLRALTSYYGQKP